MIERVWGMVSQTDPEHWSTLVRLYALEVRRMRFPLQKRDLDSGIEWGGSVLEGIFPRSLRGAISNAGVIDEVDKSVYLAASQRLKDRLWTMESGRSMAYWLIREFEAGTKIPIVVNENLAACLVAAGMVTWEATGREDVGVYSEVGKATRFDLERAIAIRETRRGEKRKAWAENSAWLSEAGDRFGAWVPRWTKGGLDMIEASLNE